MCLCIHPGTLQRVHDELADLMDMTEEVNEALGASLGQDDFDETELDDELAALGDELLAPDADAAPSYLDAVTPASALPAEPAEPAARTPVPAQAEAAGSSGGGGGAYAFPAVPARAANF